MPMNELDDLELRRLVQEASETLLNLSHAVHRRSVKLPHPPIAELAAKATDAQARMILKLKDCDLTGEDG